MVRCSLIVAGHNEGDRLLNTVRSCVETCAGLDYEIVVTDDASTDGSVEQVIARYPQVRLRRNSSRVGVSPTKDAGARLARGNVLVFLDGHVKPETGAIEQLVKDVELLDGRAVVTPAIPSLNPVTWQNRPDGVGNGFAVELTTFQTHWIPLSQMKPRQHAGRQFYECPALIGCACAVSRELYEQLWGFDPHMFFWGLEDIDFGLKAWLMGFPILHDPAIQVGHRFQQYLSGYSISWPKLIANQLRTARKLLNETLWNQWVEKCRLRFPQSVPDAPEGIWTQAWTLFQETRASVESERAHLMGHRVHDEFWFANRFGLPWPKLHQAVRSVVAPQIQHPLVASNGNGLSSINGKTAWGPELVMASPEPSHLVPGQVPAGLQSGNHAQSIWGPEMIMASPEPAHLVPGQYPAAIDVPGNFVQSVWDPELMTASPERGLMPNEVTESTDASLQKPGTYDHRVTREPAYSAKPVAGRQPIGRDHGEMAMSFSRNDRAE